jgi:hypothetical protein
VKNLQGARSWPQDRFEHNDGYQRQHEGNPRTGMCRFLVHADIDIKQQMPKPGKEMLREQPYDDAQADSPGNAAEPVTNLRELFFSF